MIRVLYVFLCVLLVGCQSNIDKSTNKTNPLNDQALDKLVCNNIANVDDDDFIEFFKFSVQMENKGMNQLSKDKQIKVFTIMSKALKGDNQIVKINKNQAYADLFTLKSKFGEKLFIPDEKGMDIILKNLPKHRAANLLRFMLKLGCKSSKTYK